MRPQSVLQTPALASIKSSYSPQHSEDARKRIEEAYAIECEKDKENSENFRNNENNTVFATSKNSMSQTCIDRNNHQERFRPGPVEHSLNGKFAHSEHKSASTPTPLESTAIIARQEKELVSSETRGRKQWKGISEGTSTILNTMSPIPLNEGNEHGFTVDSYYQPNDTSVFKQAKVNTSEVMQKNIRLSETFAKPFLPSNAGNLKSKFPDRRSTTALPSSAFTSNVGKLMHPELTPGEGRYPHKEDTFKVDKANPLIDSSGSVPKARNITKIINTSARSPSKKSPKTAGVSPRTPAAQLETRGEVFSGASPNTMLNESLTLISNMKMPNLNGSMAGAYGADESGLSPCKEVNASLSCSIISQGMVSPESFMEDMRNASISFSHHDCLETNSTSTPNLPNNGNIADKNVAIASSSSISGTPNKPRPPSTRFGPKRRSFTSLFQKEQMKRVAAAVKAVKHDKDELESVTQTSCKAMLQNGVKSVISKKGKQVTQSCGAAPAQSELIPRSKALEDKEKITSKKRSPPRMRSPTKRLRKEALTKQMNAKPKGRKESHLSESISEIERRGISYTTPNSKLNQCDSNTVVKSRSYESNTITKSRSEDSNSKSRYFPDIFASDYDCVDTASNNVSCKTRRQLCPEVTETSTFADPRLELFKSQDFINNEDNREVNDGCPNMYDRVVAAVERIPSSPLSSPMKFKAMSPMNLPTSPGSMTSDQNKRATLTVTKSRPSDALLAAMNNEKLLFEETSRQGKLNPTNCHMDEGNSEMCENIEVTVKESYEEKEGKVYLLVKETTCMTKSTTDTYVEQISVEGNGTSPGQFCTPTRLPNSPNPQHSRRSTHVLRSPKVIDKTGMKTKKLEFETEKDQLCAKSSFHKEKSKSLEDMANVDDVLSKTRSDTFEKEPTLIADPDHQSQLATKSNTFEKENSILLDTTSMMSSVTKPDTFEKETTNVLGSSKDTETTLLSDKHAKLKWSDRKPITAVCAMSPNLVDYDDIGSEDGGSAGNITKDSLDTTTQSEDSLDKSKASEHGGNAMCYEKSNKNCEVKPDIRKCVTDPKVFAAVDGADRVPAEDQDENRASTVKSDEEEDKFYDTLSQRYYDALSDTCDADLEDDLVGAGICDFKKEIVSDGCLKQSVKEVENAVVQSLQTCTNPSLSGHRENAIFDKVVIDRKEKFFIQYRQTLKMKQRDQEVSRVNVLSENKEENHKSKKKLRRSLSADQLDQPITFSVDISDLKKSSGVKEEIKPEIGKSTQKISKKCPPKSQQDFLKPTNQSKISRGRTAEIADSKLKSQSLSNLQNLQDKKALKGYEERAGTKTFAKSSKTKSFFLMIF